MTKLLHIPENHALRFSLHNEIHARPPVSLKLPVSASHLAVTLSKDEKVLEYEHLKVLCSRFAVNPPPKEASHFTAVFDTFLFHWEQHGEFSTYCFYVNSVDSIKPFAKAALAYAPMDWLDKLVGKSIVATHAVIMPTSEKIPSTAEISRYFGGNAIVGSQVTGGDATAFTDFRIHNDGFSRLINTYSRNKQVVYYNVSLRLKFIESCPYSPFPLRKNLHHWSAKQSNVYLKLLLIWLSMTVTMVYY